MGKSKCLGKEGREECKIGNLRTKRKYIKEGSKENAKI